MEAGAVFPTTHWTVVAQAAGPGRAEAIEKLYRIYWSPLCAYARRFGASENDAEDIVQEFFKELCRGTMLDRASASRGRFRSFLLGGLRRALWRWRSRSNAAKRGGGLFPFPLDEDLVGAAESDSDPQFDADWANALVAQSLARFDNEFRHLPDAEKWQVLKRSLLGEDTRSHSEIGRELHLSPAAVKSRLFRLRQRHREILREEVLRTVSSAEECDEELRYLLRVLQCR